MAVRPGPYTCFIYVLVCSTARLWGDLVKLFGSRPVLMNHPPSLKHVTNFIEICNPVMCSDLPAAKVFFVLSDAGLSVCPDAIGEFAHFFRCAYGLALLAQWSDLFSMEGRDSAAVDIAAAAAVLIPQCASQVEDEEDNRDIVLLMDDMKARIGLCKVLRTHLKDAFPLLANMCLRMMDSIIY